MCTFKNPTSLKVRLTVPVGTEVRFAKMDGKLFFVFGIGGHYYRPQFTDILRFQRLYGVKSYVSVSQFMQGETLTLIRTSL